MGKKLIGIVIVFFGIIFLNEAGYAGNSKWMETHWKYIKDHTMYDIILPGTHNSGIFSWHNTIAYRNQENDINQQLKDGIRVFDIRVMKRSNIFTMHHKGVFVTDGSQDLKKALDQIKNFLKNNDHEIIIIKLKPGDGSNLDATIDGKEVHNFILKRIGNHICTESLSSSLKDIKAQKKRIIIFSEFETNDETSFRPACWIKDTWGKCQSEGCKGSYTPQEKIKWLKLNVEKYLTSKTDRFLYASCFIWTINLNDAAKKVNPEVEHWIKEWSQNENKRENMNIFVLDFYNWNNNKLVNKIINMNKR